MATDYTPRRIVSLQPSATVIIERLGLLDRVVACTRYCADVCPEAARGRAIVADSWTAQAGEILAAKPDLVIASVPYQEEAVGEILKAGIRFLGFAPRTLADIYGDIAAIAGILGAAERGDAVIGKMQGDVAAIATRTRGTTGPRVYCEEWGKPLIHSQRWVAELVEAAGGEFLGAPGKQTTAEQVRDMNPEVIIAAWCGAGDRVPLEKMVRDRQWQDLAAARNRRVFCIRDELLNTPAPTLVGGLRALGHAIHPDLFPTAEGIRGIAAPVL
ncbi:MAG: ABC transporter substrate-binding protein [Acidobacteriia bacterium]|nr:ABC transporter substrate-binding protein [Terriglobia bacterium]